MLQFVVGYDERLNGVTLPGSACRGCWWGDCLWSGDYKRHGKLMPYSSIVVAVSSFYCQWQLEERQFLMLKMRQCESAKALNECFAMRSLCSSSRIA